MKRLVVLKNDENVNKITKILECLSSMKDLKSYILVIHASKDIKAMLPIFKEKYGFFKIFFVSFELWSLGSILRIVKPDEVYVINYAVQKRNFDISKLLQQLAEKKGSENYEGICLKIYLRNDTPSDIGFYKNMLLFQLVNDYVEPKKKWTGFLNNYVDKECELVRSVVDSNWITLSDDERKAAQRMVKNVINSK